MRDIIIRLHPHILSSAPMTAALWTGSCPTDYRLGGDGNCHTLGEVKVPSVNAPPLAPQTHYGLILALIIGAAWLAVIGLIVYAALGLRQRGART